MKTVRVNMETFVKMMRVKHEQELEKRDVVNMSDVMDVIMDRLERLMNGATPEEVSAIKYVFTDEAEVVAKPLHPDEVEDEEDEDEEDEPRTPPKPRRKAATRKTTKKPRTSSRE